MKLQITEKEVETLERKLQEINEKMNDPDLCLGTSSTYMRITGYYRNIANFNKGKAQEKLDTKFYTV
jgi:anaerobic ribonucleoside-triphosphate reductase